MGFVGGTGCLNVDIIYAGLSHLPREGEEVFAKEFGLYLGGGVPGSLVNTSRLGVPSKLLTYLGTGGDVFTGFARQALKDSGVDFVDLYNGDDIAVNVTSVMVHGAERTFLSYGAVECSLFNGYSDLEESVYQNLKGATIVDMHADFLSVYRRLKRDGSVLVFDTGWENDLCWEKYQEYLNLADYYLPNRKEALKITGTDTVEDAAERLGECFENVIIKLDQDGCLLKNRDGITRIPPVPGVVAVDATGAGDAFMSGFLFGLYHHYPVGDCIRFGNIMGAECVSHMGSVTGHLNEQEILARFRQVYG